jgi:NAD(P)-dependent dehydrogenase (short-subunit alcohol dehydrogenase family)
VDDLRLDGRAVVVSGGAEGIGRATAERAQRLGARVAVLDVQPMTYEGPLAIDCDVASGAAVERAFEVVARELGPTAVLVNNAGVAPHGPFDEIDEKSWRRTLDVNLTGMYLCTRAALPQLRRARRASIVNVASQAARHRSLACDAAYAAAKGGVLPLTRQLGYELAGDGIRVNCVCPGAVDTQIPRRNLTRTERAAMVANVPLGRAADPAEIAAVICFLASDAASFMTGAVVDVNGGVL